MLKFFFSFLTDFLHVYQSSFNQNKYWRRRLYLQNRTAGLGGVLSKYYIIWCRRYEAKRNANTGIGLPDFCCKMEGKVNFPHGLNGIIIARNVIIGKDVTIFQHVTIAESKRTAFTVIEDNVMIGAGAVILNNVRIGRGASIGANAVVVNDVPAGTTAVGVPAHIINKKVIKG